ncbi:MAG: ATP-binding cassette domain-containing protein [Flammeovirgaceae bacterium]
MQKAHSLVVSLRDVTIRQAHDRLVMNNISFDIAKGEFVYLIGKTGSGKSSILKILYADLPFEEGQVMVAGYDLKKISSKDIPFLRRRLGIVFQDFELLTDRNVKENLEFVMKATGWIGQQKINERIDYLLNLVGLPNIHYRFPHQLSGGEQQRVAIARALVNQPDILLADEPTGNLDPTISHEILNVFLQIHQQGTTVLIATHYHNFIKTFPARVIFCENGQIKDIDKKQVLQHFSNSMI